MSVMHHDSSPSEEIEALVSSMERLFFLSYHANVLLNHLRNRRIRYAAREASAARYVFSETW